MRAARPVFGSNGDTRVPAVAGQFYPDDPAELARLVDRLVDAVTVADGEPPGSAYIVPHAGYRYSGPTAAHVYARLRARAARCPPPPGGGRPWARS
jgi:AmmeMemoRadiSam system protein B